MVIYDYTASAVRVLINTSGYVGIGTNSPGYRLTVSGTAWCTSGAWESDSTKKKNIQDISLNALTIIDKLRPVTFEWKKAVDNGMKGTQMGFLAQEIETVLPSMIVLMHDTIKSKVTKQDSVTTITKGIKYNELFSLFVSAMQQQQKMIDSLKADVAKCCTATERINNNDSQGKSETTLQVELANKNETILYQNEPNPFDGSTVIRYFIPETSGNAYIGFYDMYGKEIKKLEIKEKGFGKVEANTENLASGIYSYSIIINDKMVETKKMMKNK